MFLSLPPPFLKVCPACEKWQSVFTAKHPVKVFFSPYLLSSSFFTYFNCFPLFKESIEFSLYFIMDDPTTVVEKNPDDIFEIDIVGDKYMHNVEKTLPQPIFPVLNLLKGDLRIAAKYQWRQKQPFCDYVESAESSSESSDEDCEKYFNFPQLFFIVFLVLGF